MYIGSTGPSGLHHLVYEVVDNSVDEAMAGYCDPHRRHAARRRRLPGRRQRPRHPGRPHPEYHDKSAAEIVLTMLHAGGKFGGEGYKISGGLHGVGVSVVNALSRRLDARDPPRRRPVAMQHFVDGGKPAGQARAKSATSDEARHDHHVLARRARSSRRSSSARRRCSSACARWRSSTRASRSSSATSASTRSLEQVFKYDGGIIDFVKHLNASKEPLFKRVIAFDDTDDDGEVDVAMQWNTGFYEGLHSFANNIATTEGGMHEEGFKKALTNVVNRYAEGQGPPQGEGREPPRRGHPRGPHRDRLGEAAQPAVRGPDQDQARQHRDALARREGHQREARRLARGAPDRGQGRS